MCKKMLICWFEDVVVVFVVVIEVRYDEKWLLFWERCMQGVVWC